LPTPKILAKTLSQTERDGGGVSVAIDPPTPEASAEPSVLWSLPSGYQDLRVVREQFLPNDEPRLYRFSPNGPVITQGALGFSGNSDSMHLSVTDQIGNHATINLFGAPYDIIEHAKRRTDFFGIAKVFGTRAGLLVTHPRLVSAADLGSMVAVYRKEGAMTPALRRSAVEVALESEGEWTALCAEAQARFGVSFERMCQQAGFRFGGKTLLRALHHPLSPEQADDAQRAAKAVSCVSLLHEARLNASAREAASLPVVAAALEAAMQRASVVLTLDQQCAIRAISDFLQSTRFKLLLSGDVGTGKTLAYLVPLLAALHSNAETMIAVVAPNALIARAVFQTSQAMACGLPMALLTGASNIGDFATARLVVGTSALFARSRRYDAVLIDEMHKFSVAQRERLLKPAGKLLEATATCVPRSQALVSIGESCVVRLRERPFERTVETLRLDSEESRPLIARALRQEIAAGGQVALLYPTVESSKARSSEEADLKGAMLAFDGLQLSFPGVVGLIHGRMKEEEKQAVIDRMNNGALKVLVCTTVIELGITLPDLRLIVVVNPARLGLSTLHQIRGRIARLGGRGRFILHHPSEATGDALLRAETLCETDDGFEIAERDLRIRGMGEVAGANVQAGKIRPLFRGVVITVDDVLQAAALLEQNARTTTEEIFAKNALEITPTIALAKTESRVTLLACDMFNETPISSASEIAS
jgi:ATP-dependent DNA helicase RecG